MSTLTSLLVRDQRVSVRKIEEAIQRQVIVGGGLDTVLLELGELPEDVMAAYCAAVHGLLPATRDEVMRLPRDTVRIVPREVAERHRLIPLVLEAGTLVVAVTDPLESAVEEQLSFLLGVDLVQRIVTEARLAAALHHHYGVEMSPRLRRLTDKLRQREPGVVPFVAPLEVNLVERASNDWTRDDEGDDEDDTDDEDERDAPPTAEAEAEGPRTRRFGVVAPPTLDNEAAVRVGVAQVVGVRYGSRPPPAPSEPPAAAATEISIPRAPAVPSVPAPAARDHAPEPPRVSVPKSAVLRRHRGPLTARKAVELLGEADSRDTILEISFAFTRQFFDTTALFVVHEDSAEVIDLVGPGASFDEARRPGVALDEPGSFPLVREGVVPLITHLDQSDSDRAIRRTLGRDDAMPAVLVPVAIKQRVVLVLYGDRSGDDFGLADVPELLAFAPRMSEAFQRLILRSKRGRGPARQAPVEPAPPTEPSPPPTADESRRSAKTEPGWSRPPSGAWTGSTAVGPTPEAEPVSPPATEPPPRRRRPRRRSEAFAVLGIPREAPPPPTPTTAPEAGPAEAEGSAPVVVGVPAPTNGAVLSSEDRVAARPAEGSGAIAVGVPVSVDEDDPRAAPDAEHPTRDARLASSDQREQREQRDEHVDGDGVASEPRDEHAARDEGAAEAAPALADDTDDETDGDDDEPELEIGEPDERELAELRELERPRRAPRDRAGTYRMSGGVEEVVFTPTKRGRDPRRDGEDPLADEIVRLDGITPVASRASRAPHSEPPAAVPAPADLPSVIVEMDESVEALVAELRGVGPDDDGHAVSAVVGLGEIALPVLVREFPGALWFDRHSPHRRLPRGRDVSAVARTIVAFSERAVPYVASLLDRDDADERFYATLVASELPHRDLIAPLGRRVFDDDGKLAALALDVLGGLRAHDDEIAEVLQLLRATARVPRYPAERRARAATALGALRDVGALDLLVALLEAHEDVLAEAAHRSLVVLTAQDFGMDPERWDPWVAENGDLHRIEWLIEGLLHASEDIRRAAGEELKSLTQEYYGYHPALPRRDREVAQRKYRRWWETEGHRRFLRD